MLCLTVFLIQLMLLGIKDSGTASSRRNVEVLARGLINHVRITDLDGPNNTLPDDVVEYDGIVRGYRPRSGSELTNLKRSIGRYLEKPLLHYSIGTRITPRVVESLSKYGYKDALTHKDEPSFMPEMQRAADNLSHSPDWQVRLGGYGLKNNLLKSVHRGASSAIHGDSYMPALAQAEEFAIGEKGQY
jgi:hypothetical protein